MSRATISRSSVTLPTWAFALVVLAACNRTPPAPPPPPPASAAPAVTSATTAATPTTVPAIAVAPTPTGAPVASMVPVTSVPAPSPSEIALSADAAVCGAALHCCEATAHAARTVARREGYDPRDDPRRDPRFDPSYGGYGDPREDPRVRRVASRLVSGCQQLREPDAAHARRCAEQIETIRRTLREVGAPIPSSCHVPDLSAVPTLPSATQ